MLKIYSTLLIKKIFLILFFILYILKFQQTLKNLFDMNTEKNSNFPNYISGLVQADGSFFVVFNLQKKYKHGIRIRPKFTLTLDYNSKQACEAVQQFFYGSGKIYENKKRHSVEFVIDNLQYLLEFIIPHFTNYPLFGSKRVSFSIFSKIIYSLVLKKHYDKNFFAVILRLAFLMNPASQRTEIRKKQLLDLLGKTEKDCSFNSLILNEFIIKKERELDPNFLSGLIDGDGSFFVNFLAHKKIKLGFHITGHKDQEVFFEKIKETLGCGSVKNKTPFLIRYMVNDLKSLKNIIIPLIEKGRLYTKKKEYFDIFKKVLNLLLDTKKKKNAELDIIKIINLAYDMNFDGKRRKLTKKEYLSKYVYFSTNK